MFEALCLGTPTLVLAQNKHQAKNARRIERKNCVVYLGEGTKISNKKIMRKVLLLINSLSLREKHSVNAKKNIDGLGIFKVLEQIELCM